MKHYATNISNKSNLLYQKIESEAYIAKGVIEEYHKAKGTHVAKGMCYSIPLRGDRVNPNYCTNSQFTAHQRITCSKSTTETLKASSEITHG